MAGNQSTDRKMSASHWCAALCFPVLRGSKGTLHVCVGSRGVPNGGSRLRGDGWKGTKDVARSVIRVLARWLLYREIHWEDSITALGPISQGLNLAQNSRQSSHQNPHQNYIKKSIAQKFAPKRKWKLPKKLQSHQNLLENSRQNSSEV